MARQVRTSAVMLLMLMTVTGLLYPLAMTGLGQLLFPARANGSIVMRNGTPVGSLLIGQQFTSRKYFWSRPSATTPFPNNAASSGGSNYGPLNPGLIAVVTERARRLHAADLEGRSDLIPVDLVTSSGSGLDPHISIAAAIYQAPRVARARGMSEESVRALIAVCTDGRDLVILGEPGVNVLRLNLALDDATRHRDAPPAER